MNVHIANDEKFIDGFIHNAKLYTDTENLFFILNCYNNLKHVKSSNIHLIEYDFNALKKKVLELEEGSNIFFHQITNLFAELICDPEFQSKRYKTNWLFFGSEVFGFKEFNKYFLLPKTYAFLKKTDDSFFKFSFNPVKLRRNIINSFYYTRNRKKSENKTKKAIQRINRIGHFIEYDIKEYIKPIAPKLEWLNWNYYSCEQESHIHVSTVKENQILLGNSASIYNNHLDAIEFLRTIISSEKLIVPLSYGGNDNYKEEVLNAGNRYFGDNLIALDKFYSPDEYYNIIGTSKAAVFFNVRSQAAGNVLWCLMNNIPVFLLKDNPLFSFFNSNSIRVFSIYDDLEDFLKYSYGDFKFHSLEENILNIDYLFGHHAMSKKYNDLLR